jgi:hypothetical protein
MWVVRKCKDVLLTEKMHTAVIVQAAGRSSMSIHIQSREGEGETKRAEWHGIDGSQFVGRRIVVTPCLVSARGLPGLWYKHRGRRFVKHIINPIC